MIASNSSLGEITLGEISKKLKVSSQAIEVFTIREKLYDHINSGIIPIVSPLQKVGNNSHKIV